MEKKSIAKKSVRIAAGVTTLGLTEVFLWASRTGKAAPQKLADAQRKELLKASENFTKPMVVRTYGAKEQKRMESDGSALLENGYVMQGQSGFAENGGTTVLSVFTANRSKGQTTITWIKKSTKAKAKGR